MKRLLVLLPFLTLGLAFLILFVLRFIPAWQLFAHVFYWILMGISLLIIVLKHKSIKTYTKTITVLLFSVMLVFGLFRSTGLINLMSTYYCHDQALFHQRLPAPRIDGCNDYIIYIYSTRKGFFTNNVESTFFINYLSSPLLIEKFQVNNLPFYSEVSTYQCSNDSLSIITDNQLVLKADMIQGTYIEYPYEYKSKNGDFELNL